MQDWTPGVTLISDDRVWTRNEPMPGVSLPVALYSFELSETMYFAVDTRAVGN
jgi:hypothetical protein